MKHALTILLISAILLTACSRPSAPPTDATTPTTTVPITTAAPVTTAPAPPERLLPTPYIDIDFAAGTITDTAGHMSATLPADPLGRVETTALSIAGERHDIPHLYVEKSGGAATLTHTAVKSEGELQALLADGFTVEAVLVNGNALTAGDAEQCMANSGQSGGFGLSVNGGRYTFGVYTGGSWRRTSLPEAYPIDALTHLLGVYDADSATVTLYVNGEPVSTADAPGNFRPAQESCWSRIILGGDTGAKGTELHATNTRIADYKLYAAAMTAGQAKTACTVSMAALCDRETDFTLRYLDPDTLAALQGERIFATLADSYAEVHQPSTGLVSPPTLWQTADGRESDLATADSRPATVLFALAYKDGQLRAMSTDGRDLGALRDAVSSIAGRCIPAFNLTDPTHTDLLIDFINHNRIADCFVVSADPEALVSIDRATRAARIVLDAVNREIDVPTLFLEASACGTKLLLLDAAHLTQENVLALRSRSMSVFAQLNQTDPANLHDAIFAGVAGIVTADSAGALSYYAALTDRTVSSPTLMVAHRGDPAGCPDNTLRSLIAAAESGASATEFDVWMTADGHLVLNHDAKTTGWSRQLDCKAATRAELEALTCTDRRGKPEDKMTFYEEVMAYFAKNHTDMIFTVEIKDAREAVVDRLVAITREYGMLDRTIFISMNDAIDRYAYQTYGVAIQDNLSTHYPGNNQSALAQTCLDLAALPTSYYCQWSNASPIMRRMLAHRGIKYSPWTTANASENDLHYSMAVDEFTTNVPHHSDAYPRFLVAEQSGDGKTTVTRINYDGSRVDVTAEAERIPIPGSDRVTYRLNCTLPVRKTYSYFLYSPTIAG